MANNEYTLQDIYDALTDIDRTLNTTADGTNWTVADSLSNIAYELGRIADVFRTKEKQNGSVKLPNQQVSKQH